MPESASLPMPLPLIILEYLRLILSWPVVSGGIAATIIFLYNEQFRRILTNLAMLRIGGVEVSLQQQSVTEIAMISDAQEMADIDSGGHAPDGAVRGTETDVETLLKAQRAIATIWHFRFLNYYLVHKTQMVLNWFYYSSDPITREVYDATYSAITVVERGAVLEALLSNELIVDENNLLKITSKGSEYATWQGRTLMGYVLPPGGTPLIPIPAAHRD